MLLTEGNRVVKWDITKVKSTLNRPEWTTRFQSTGQGAALAARISLVNSYFTAVITTKLVHYFDISSGALLMVQEIADRHENDQSMYVDWIGEDKLKLSTIVIDPEAGTSAAALWESSKVAVRLSNNSVDYIETGLIDEINQLCFSLDGNQLAVVTRSSIEVYSKNKTLVVSVYLHSGINQVCWFNDTSLLTSTDFQLYLISWQGDGSYSVNEVSGIYGTQAVWCQNDSQLFLVVTRGRLAKYSTHDIITKEKFKYSVNSEQGSTIRREWRTSQLGEFGFNRDLTVLFVRSGFDNLLLNLTDGSLVKRTQSLQPIEPSRKYCKANFHHSVFPSPNGSLCLRKKYDSAKPSRLVAKKDRKLRFRLAVHDLASNITSFSPRFNWVQDVDHVCWLGNSSLVTTNKDGTAMMVVDLAMKNNSKIALRPVAIHRSETLFMDAQSKLWCSPDGLFWLINDRFSTSRWTVNRTQIQVNEQRAKEMLKIGLSVHSAVGKMITDGVDKELIQAFKAKHGLLKSEEKEKEMLKKASLPDKGLKRATSDGKLKRLHWTALSAKAVGSSVWKEVDDSEVRYDAVDLERQFLMKVRSKPITEERLICASKHEFVSKKRSQRVQIALRGLHMEELAHLTTALLSMDEETMNLEALDALIAIAPSADEQHEAEEQASKHDVENFGVAESFFYALSSFYQLETRLELWRFKQQFTELTGDLSSQFKKVIKACRELQKHQGLRTLLTIILAFGNRLNIGDKRKANCYGYDLHILDNLTTLKAVNGQSFLVYLYRFCDADEEYAEALCSFCEELAPLLKVAKHIELDTAVKAMDRVDKLFSQIKSLIDSDSDQSTDVYESSDRFIAVMSAFYRSNSLVIRGMRGQVKRCLTLSDQVKKHFCFGVATCDDEEEGASKEPIESLFALLHRFVSGLEDAKQHLLRLAKEEAKRERKRRGMDGKAMTPLWREAEKKLAFDDHLFSTGEELRDCLQTQAIHIKAGGIMAMPDKLERSLSKELIRLTHVVTSSITLADSDVAVDLIIASPSAFITQSMTCSAEEGVWSGREPKAARSSKPKKKKTKRKTLRERKRPIDDTRKKKTKKISKK